MKIICIIPSRLGSTRLPRKPLLPIQGKPMIQWTYENAMRCPLLAEVVVATDSEEIANCIRQIGGKVKMTDPALPTGSARVAEVAKDYPDADIVINLQGDEPFIKPAMLETLVSPWMAGEKPLMTTLAFPLSADKYHASAAVKVITNINNDALYFSRSPIPFYRTQDDAPVYNHMGVYAFTREFLKIYQDLPETPLGKVECLEQLRVLEHGYPIRVCLSSDKTLEINTPEEYEQAQFFEYNPGE